MRRHLVTERENRFRLGRERAPGQRAAMAVVSTGPPVVVAAEVVEAANVAVGGERREDQHDSDGASGSSTSSFEVRGWAHRAISSKRSTHSTSTSSRVLGRAQENLLHTYLFQDLPKFADRSMRILCARPGLMSNSENRGDDLLELRVGKFSHFPSSILELQIEMVGHGTR